jgi:heme exporter protein B
MTEFLRLLRFDLRLQARQPAAWAALVLFFILVIVLLPFAIGPDADLLNRLAPGLIWLAALLMSLLALDKLFIADTRDGTLDLMLLSPMPLPLIVFGKLLAQMAMIFLALALMILPAALLLDMNFGIVPVLLLSLALGVPVLVLLGGIAAATTVALHRNPALLTLLLIPFYIPVLIFAVGACDAVLMGASARPHLFLLGAMLALLVPTSPFVIAATLRNMQE